MFKKEAILMLVVLFTATILGGCASIAVHSKGDVMPPPYAGTNLAITKTKKL